MADDVVCEVREQDRGDFYSFLAAPHGDADAEIRIVYMSIEATNLVDDLVRVQEFVADAHSRGIEVEFLTGKKTWALQDIDPTTGKPWNDEGNTILQTVLNYNAVSEPYQRFDGIQYDVEPYTMTYPLNWSVPAERTNIWTQFMISITNWQSRVDNHKVAENDPIRFGMAIPRFWDPGIQEPADHRLIQDVVDYVTVMDYTHRVIHAVNDAQSEMNYAEDPNNDGDRSDAKPESVALGIETIDVNWTEPHPWHKYMFMHSASFFSKNNEDAEALIAALEDAYENPTITSNNFSSFIGTSFHYYEDIAQGETSYRGLDLILHNRAPFCFVRYPSGGEIVSGREGIRYSASDPDGDATTIELYLSSDGGQNWRLLPAMDADGNPMSDNDGEYLYNFSEETPGTNFLIRIEASEIGSGSLSGSDWSDNLFRVATSKSDSSSPSIEGVVISPIPSPSSDPAITNIVKDFKITWTAATDTGPVGESGVQGYYYSLHGPVLDIKTASFTRGHSGVLHADSPGNLPVYVWAVDRSGSVSPPVTHMVLVYADLDEDGLADPFDQDMDGDGVSNTDETAAETDPSDPESYDTALVMGLWQFDLDSGVNSLSSEYDLATTRGGTTYATSTQFYAGNRVAHITADPSTSYQVQTDITPGSITALTVEMWIKPEGKEEDMTYMPLAFEGDVETGLSCILKNDGDYMAFRSYSGGDPERRPFQGLNANNDLLFDGDWHHVAYVYNGYSRSLKIYVDGQLVAQKTGGKIPASLTHSGKMTFFDGRSEWDDDTNFPGMPTVPNRAQFVSNLFNDYETNTLYQGFVDDIRVTLAAVPVSHLGFYHPPAGASPDLDADGVSDLMEQSMYKTHPLLPDTDGDGTRDGDEISAGTDPLDAGSVFRSSMVSIPSSDSIVIEWNSIEDKSYSVMTTPDLGVSFNTLTNGIFATPPVNTYTDQVEALSSQFYRIDLE